MKMWKILYKIKYCKNNDMSQQKISERAEILRYSEKILVISKVRSVSGFLPDSELKHANFITGFFNRKFENGYFEYKMEKPGA